MAVQNGKELTGSAGSTPCFLAGLDCLCLQGLYGNQVLTGSQIVQTRHPMSSLAKGGAKHARACKPGSLAQELAAECSNLRTE